MKNIIILLFCLLTACTGFFQAKPLPLPSPALSWPERQAQLEKIQHWQADGSMSIRQSNQTTAFSFQWQQNQARYALQFFAPLGLGSVRVTGDAHQVALWQSATQKITAKNPDVLIQRQLGYAIPVSSLYYWIRGLPDPRFAMTKTLDADHHLAHLQQQGWKIDFLNFKMIAGVDLPSLLVLENASLHVKMVINTWDLS